MNNDTKKNKEENKYAGAASAAAGKLGIYLSSVTVLSLIAAAVTSLAVLLNYDTDPGYFQKGLLPSLAMSITAVTFIIILSAFVLLPKELPTDKPSGSSAAYFVSTFCAFMCLFEGGFKLYEIIKPESIEAIKTAFEKDTMYDGRRLQRIAAFISVIAIVSSFGAAAAFFLRSGSREKIQSRRNTVIIAGMFPVLRAIMGFAGMYFDQETVMNGSAKVICESAFVMLIFFLLCESRMEIGETRALPRAYAVTGLGAMLLSFVAGVSVGFGWIAGKITGERFMTESLFLLIMSLYCFIRVKDYKSELEAVCGAASAKDGSEVSGDEENAVCDNAADDEYNPADLSDEHGNAAGEDTAPENEENNACNDSGDA
ncbi:MAG: hypothetical protein MJ137_01685 [Clostridia bacterium]|nr:hypothetical protein [Clostridia bacterium]